MSFKSRERAHQLAWKGTTTTLSAKALESGLYTGSPDAPEDDRDEMFLHEERSEENLFPWIRDEALELFVSIGADWHDGPTTRLPSNYLMDSQVSCVNCLLPLAHHPEALASFFRPLVPEAVSAQVVEDNRSLTFEWIGLGNPLGEPSSRRRRGAYGTSIDAYCILCCEDGRRIGLAIEWKYTESYPRMKHHRHRIPVYRPHMEAPAGPLCCDTIGGCASLFCEPSYQLARSQCLAWRMEQARELGVDEVRFVVIVPQGNQAYRQQHHSGTLARVFPGLGPLDVHRRLLRRTDRFAVTSIVELVHAFDEGIFPSLEAPMSEVRRRYVDGRHVE